MKKLFFAFLALSLAAPAFAGSEKIDPQSYICAEILVENTTGEPPLFEGLQLDGYVAQKNGQSVADPTIMESMLIQISDLCQLEPADKVIDHWKKLRAEHEIANDASWDAQKTTCGEYYANEEDGSGFLIWADGWQRAKTGKDDSILENQETFDKFLAACKKSPDKLVIDVIAETLKK